MPALIIEKLCRGCQRCIHVCENKAIKLIAHTPVVQSDLCDECEACMEVCMQGAITISASESK
ncbi:MAG: 4Fe-4S ferredoxin [Desulfitobacterium hafniense]|nr:4Fe-4S ferredoxin [Desulfitobacterium hafniense]